MTEAVIRTDFNNIFNSPESERLQAGQNEEKSPVKKKSDIAGQTGHTPFKECPVPMSCPGKKSP